MPSVLTYPGVYVEELPSGVRTITGVGTSTAAFVGFTASGPVNRAVRIFSFADFERAFGGLNRASAVSYAVQQFFQNGGTDAYVVRVAAGATAAAVPIQDESGTLVLTATAVSPGAWGNNLRVEVDYATTNPDSSFNLTVTRVNPATQLPVETETYRNLSMNSASPAYAVATVNAASSLITLARAAGLAFANAGTSSSDSLAGFVANSIPATQDTLVLAVDGTPYTLTIPNPDTIGTVAVARTRINTAIAANPGANGKVSATVSSNRIVLASATTGESSSVVVLPGGARDIAPSLKLGLANGGTEIEGAAQRRPAPTGTVGGPTATVVSPVSGTLNVAVVSHTGAGNDTLVNAAGLTLPATPFDAAFPGALETFLHASIAGPVGQSIKVDLVGGRLRLRLGAQYPFATLAVTGAAATAVALPADPSAGTNVQRYALGLGVAMGGEGAGTPGVDGTAPGAAEYLGSQAQKTGIYALLDVDLFNLLCIPGTTELGDAQAKSVIQAAVALCEAERAFMVVDPPPNRTKDTIVAWATDVTTSTNAALYWPAIMAADPQENFRVRQMPSSGVVAGVMARTDTERGVWKAPAGTDASLRGTAGLAYPLTDMENGPLNQNAVNALRTFPVYNSVVWGARTLGGADQAASDYKYIPVRRLALYLEESLYRGTQWVVFEPNAEPLWAQIRLNVGAFMNNLFRQGAFKGTTPQQAYLVRCDATTTTQNDIDLGIVRIVVGFAPLKPAEFVILQIQQLAGQVSV